MYFTSKGHIFKKFLCADYEARILIVISYMWHSELDCHEGADLETECINTGDTREIQS